MHVCIYVLMCNKTFTLAFFWSSAELEATQRAEKAHRQTLDSKDVQLLLHSDEHRTVVRLFLYYFTLPQMIMKNIY